MKSAVKRIGVLTSGGDAPGMNAAIRSVVRASMHMGIECLGIRRGFNGLITGDITSMDFVQTSGLIGRGGTVLYTARSDEFKTPEGRKKAANTCKLFGLDGIVGIGGDGTYRGLLEFSNQEGIAVVGVPGTIDNDIACTEYTIGYDTACNTALDAIDRLKDTMQSHERCSVVEVMGRHAGHLALYVGVACGATAVLIPEKEIDFQRDVVEPIRAARLAGRTHFMVIVAEGVGSSYDVAAQIKEYTGLDPRVTVLGHVQRGGSPSARDRMEATYMGYNAVELLAQGKTNRVVAMQKGAYVDYDINEALAMKKGIDERVYTVLRALIGAEEKHGI
ncbi:MAG: 6-phosphofructokinase [Pseudoflavonifractor capillosus]|uniref:ATP-dependent 6-phosphofructokinase n=1 Tax=Pseudoflavonifractor capillosus ATCC 29799 TaxID=411467 RepID=A6NUV7_9FIRM|nr:6-phosphofructokinase [Pseudoflavonifractor capillosus]EDN00158.1 6-phosphofructokinase [Pseudoflavonifractor capillosus ATCC 29799]MCI5929289.1 6-phosphofructokinase [Pseudoflavonifractor capillosus]MDY4661290.1 6-phosphofructokinase [Pseudoflavonifractor capillosus]SCJ13048.1 6-phosphofructokinase [uncultured Flavonifractor sp.]